MDGGYGAIYLWVGGMSLIFAISYRYVLHERFKKEAVKVISSVDDVLLVFDRMLETMEIAIVDIDFTEIRDTIQEKRRELENLKLEM